MQRSFLLGLLLLCILGAPTQAQTQAQAPLSAPVTTALAKHVRLFADMTLPEAVKSLSEQIGVEVKISDYLVERRLTTNLDHVTARDALDALAELEDWQWKEDTPGHIRVERRPTLAPKEMAFLSRWIQAELPRDLRDYFKLPRPEDDPKKLFWAFAEPHSTLSQDMGRAMHLYAGQQRMALEGHLPALHGGAQVFVGQLTLPEKQHLLLGLTVQAIHGTNPLLWKGDLAPFVTDPATASIKLIGGHFLFIENRLEQENGSASTGFGAPVK